MICWVYRIEEKIMSVIGIEVRKNMGWNVNHSGIHSAGNLLIVMGSGEILNICLHLVIRWGIKRLDDYWISA